VAKKTSVKRVHQLAKELGVSSKDIVSKCQAEGIPDITNHMSAISVGLAVTVREWFGGGSGESTAVETAAPVDVAAARKKAPRRAKAKAKPAGTLNASDTGDTDVAVDDVVAVAEPASPVTEAASTPVDPAVTPTTAEPSFVSEDDSVAEVPEVSEEAFVAATSDDAVTSAEDSPATSEGDVTADDSNGE
jgi:translation initiation factor IF-2